MGGADARWVDVADIVNAVLFLASDLSAGITAHVLPVSHGEACRVELRGRNALVTGAGQRIGRAIAYGLIRRGVNVAIHYHRSEHGAKATAMEAEVAVRVARLKADLSDAEAAERCRPGRGGAGRASTSRC